MVWCLYCAGARSSVYCATSRDPILTEFGQATGSDNCYFGSNCCCESPSSYATDPVLARWLWKWSADMVSLNKMYDLPGVDLHS